MESPHPNVEGAAVLIAKHSAVDKTGQWKNTPIEGVHFRPTRPVPHEDGTVAVAKKGE